MPASRTQRAEWLSPPRHRDAFHRIDSFLDTVDIPAGAAAPVALADASDEVDWAALELPQASGRTTSLGGFLTASATDAFLVLRGTSVVYERYFGGNTATTRHIAMSVSKSFCGMLAGVLAGDGMLDTAAAVTDYVPELAGGAYGGATVRQLLDMTAAPDFDMTYLGPDTAVQLGDRCAGWRPRRGDEPGGTREFLRSLSGHGRHGRAFQYCSATTDVLAWVLERAAATPYPQLMRERLWRHLGAEADALITVDEFGIPYACAGMAMRLRDLARFGLLLQAHGRRSGTQVIPASWITETRTGGDFDASEGSHQQVTYRNQWWIPDHGAAMYAVGIFGQYLWVDLQRHITIAKFSSNAHPVDLLPEQERTLPLIAAFAASERRTTASTVA